jgi:hypothetical protein
MGRQQQVCEQMQGCTIALGCSQGPEDLKKLRWRDARPLQNAVKGTVYIYMTLVLLKYHTLYSEGYDHIQNGLNDCHGLANA